MGLSLAVDAVHEFNICTGQVHTAREFRTIIIIFFIFFRFEYVFYDGWLGED